jgi:hypothetical protein
VAGQCARREGRRLLPVRDRADRRGERPENAGSSGIRFKLPAWQLLRTRGEEPQGQRLLVASVGRRPAVLFSEFDLTAAAAGIENYRALGYRSDSARQILGNLLAFLAVD